MPKQNSSKGADLGLLLIRVAVATSVFFFHGWAKISGGPERWHAIGGAMGNLGIHFLPTFWGFMAAFAETGGALMVALGLLFRPGAGLLATTMAVASFRHLTAPPGPGSGWGAASHALELLCIFLAFQLTGPGRYSVDRLWRKGR